MIADLRTLPGRATAAIVAWSVRHAAATLLMALFLTGGALTYTTQSLVIDTDMSNMIDPALPHLVAGRHYRAAFPEQPGDVVVFTEGTTAAANGAAEALTKALRSRGDIATAVIRPGNETFFANHGLLYLDTGDLAKLDERLQAAEPLLGALANDPTLHGLFSTLGRGLDRAADSHEQAMLTRIFERVSMAFERTLAGKRDAIHWQDELFETTGKPSHHRAFVLMTPTLDPHDVQPAAPAIEALRKLLATMAPQFPEAKFRLTGAAVMDMEELVTVAEDAKVTTLLSFAGVAVVLAFGLRSLSLVAGVLITLACGLIWTAAFATFAVGALNVISVCFAVLFIGMGVDFGIQYTMRYLEELDRGTLREPALILAAKQAGGALALAAVGAALSFLAFVPTAYRGLAQLGIISGFSMLIAWFANITILPALLRFLSVPQKRAVQPTGSAWLQIWINRHSRAILVVTLILTIACGCLVPSAHFDLNPLNLKDGHTDGVVAFRALAADPDSSPYTIQILTASLAEADRIAARLRALPDVDKALTLSSFVPEAQEEKLAIIEGLQLALTGALDPGPHRAPVDAAAEAKSLREFAGRLRAPPAGDTWSPALAASAARLQYLVSALEARPEGLEAQVESLRIQLIGDLTATLHQLSRALEASHVTLETLPSSLRAEYVTVDGRARIQIMPKTDLNDNVAMAAFVHAVQQVDHGASGVPVELYEGSRAVIHACLSASLWALLLTLILHLLVLHGIIDALLVAAPLVLALLLTVATAALFGAPFNFANIIALPLLIGLNNAYGAYLVVRKNGAADVSGLLSSSTPRAILFSGMAAIASFGVLGISKHPGMAGMGILISVSLSYAILCALIVLPALMAFHENFHRGKR